MRRKRSTKNTNKLVESDILKIGSEANGQLFFEIGGEITIDIAEAVAIMMRVYKSSDPIWNRKIIIDTDSIDTRMALYWLSGGDSEWLPLQNYIKPWADCVSHFKEEYDNIILNILKESKTMDDIRCGFNTYLSLDILYEFALSNRLIR